MGCREEGKCLVVRVQDEGCGISEKDIPHIFDRYYRVKREENTYEGGTGLGLSLVRDLTLLHKGKIDVESKEGKYTKFVLRFPHVIARDVPEELFDIYTRDYWTSIADDNEQRTSQENGFQKQTLTDPEKKIILVVEDDPDMRQLVMNMLAPQYRMMEAENGAVGLEKAIASIPDLIISDVMMPEKDGYELSRDIRQHELTSHIPIILLTAKAEIRDKIHGLETGVDDYIVKPFYKQELMARIHNLLQQRAQLKEKYSQLGLLTLDNIPFASTDQGFMQKVHEVIEKYFSDETFNVRILCDELGMSRSQVHRKLKALYNKSTSEYIRAIRLEKGAELIRNQSGNISDIAYSCGFKDPSYFSRAFKEYFGSSPSDYANAE
jgi:CheY-like chemotaxis protein